ncbi:MULTISPECIES: septation ring formation regulator EzrA [Staphylococcus]|uniref:Septation ring formation regulator EzrA n=2 Tax=Staphylococcus haemolyticus TaxID=1283 RepID=A0A2K0A7D0_STAHA|nr:MULTISPECIES: septation ring formation regulator EzrA [Staphylococcus]MBY6181395.1 septation ring formation regulator EzrA [Staphylococcaceae bacterium DP2N0-1]KAA2272103.1 septation ring formation regulator EzrA [Staphylococcus sp. GDX7P312P]KAA2278963.1 septation ring formation regulator EzrA [Staphylococcus sp. GDX7P459A]KGF27148.1 septation ring formation regulator EzrA [Staphylococcus haemolyticus DNF00585]MCE4954243.1 septation ring formation regulator EzrA [Staphylococcus haemolyticu
MVLYTILAIIIIVLIIVGIMFYLRSNKRKIVEEAEERKLKVQRLPFEENLKQLSELNLKGETRTKYDAFKRDTLDYTNNYLAPVEEKIHDAEIQLDKFQFSGAQSDIDDAHELMDKYEAGYQQQVEDVNEIVSLHKENEQVYEKCKTNYREMKRDVLANRHQFGDAASPLEKRIESFEPELVQYEELKEEGNYVQAHNHIMGLNESMNEVQKYMDEIPELIREAQKELPGQFQDLKYGCRDLKMNGYDLDHVKIDGTLQSLKTELNFVEPMISRLELDNANDKLEQINDKLDEMYDLIEHEVKAKNEVEETKEQITDELFKAREMNYTLRTEIDYIRENYFINESDVHSIRQHENEIQNLVAVYDEILKEMAKSAVRYSEVKDNLEYLDDHVKVINENQEKLQNHLIQLREDEAEAEDNLLRIQSKKEEVYRRLLASNLTSVPERFIIMKNEIDHEVRETNDQFSERPIHVKQLKDKVAKIVIQMNTFEDEANDVLVNAVYAERLIQYGNRYRKDHNNVDKSLNEAERLFKNNRYKRSIEISEQALESVEPGITKYIEDEVAKG